MERFDGRVVIPWIPPRSSWLKASSLTPRNDGYFCVVGTLVLCGCMGVFEYGMKVRSDDTVALEGKWGCGRLV